MLESTAEKLQQDETVVILFFGSAQSANSRKFGRALKGHVDALSRDLSSPLQVVYISADASAVEYERYTKREAQASLVPYKAALTLGAREEKVPRGGCASYCCDQVECSKGASGASAAGATSSACATAPQAAAVIGAAVASVGRVSEATRKRMRC